MFCTRVEHKEKLNLEGTKIDWSKFSESKNTLAFCANANITQVHKSTFRKGLYYKTL